MTILETKRLRLRRLTLDDAPFIVELLNDPAFLRFIGDKGVRTLDDARNYLLKGPLDSYARLGFGLYLTELREGGTPIGICGLVKRETLQDVDIGFAFLPQFFGKGYAFESAAAVMAHAKNALGIARVVAITSPDNDGSIRVLEKVGLKLERMMRLTPDTPEIKFFS
jgi:ribosomal-protein-alanine N-acetyltransferase